ncbi:MAG: DUF1837 domain-containing protein [Candidatus Omnitrophota bacterium]
MTKILPTNLKDLFDKLVRGKPTDIQAYLTQVETALPISGTKLSVHCHAIGLDGQQFPRVKDLAKFLASRIMEYAIPRSEIDRAKKFLDSTGSPAKFGELHRKAASLFSDLEKSGESGELLLYLLVEYFLKFPQVMCKMPLKTNAQMHYHGIDGIHASVNGSTGRLALYWGESKLYKDIDAAIAASVTSIQPFLVPGGGSGDPRERDLQLMRDNLTLNSPDLEAALLRYLDPDDPLYKHLEYRGVCLIGFDHDAYPNTPHSKTEEQVCVEIKSSVATWLEKLKSRTVAASLDSFVLEVFFVPFPSVQEFRDAFSKEIGLGAPSRETS